MSAMVLPAGSLGSYGDVQLGRVAAGGPFAQIRSALVKSAIAGFAPAFSGQYLMIASRMERRWKFAPVDFALIELADMVVPFTSSATCLQHLLGQVHQVDVVGVGLVELQHGELGIVLGRDALRCGSCG